MSHDVEEASLPVEHSNEIHFLYSAAASARSADTAAYYK
jgi:hypothetical protein